MIQEIINKIKPYYLHILLIVTIMLILYQIINNSGERKLIRETKKDIKQLLTQSQVDYKEYKKDSIEYVKYINEIKEERQKLSKEIESIKKANKSLEKQIKKLDEQYEENISNIPTLSDDSLLRKVRGQLNLPL